MALVSNTVWALDPGPQTSALIGLEPGTRLPRDPLLASNDVVLKEVQALRFGTLWIEIPRSYGMPASNALLDTAFWVGRFTEACPVDVELISRKEVVLALCGTARAGDSNVIRALKDLYAEHPKASAVGSEPAVGVKTAPGPLYGIRRDLWQALAVAVVATETEENLGNG